MEVKVGDKKYEVSFIHEKAYSRPSDHDTQSKPKLVPFGTKCVITAVHGKRNGKPLVTTIATGYAKLSKGDQFSRATGRRVALHKALVSVWPESKVVYTAESGIKKTIAPAKHRIVRTVFWKNYFAKVEAAK
jgi:hypothetical protein